MQNVLHCELSKLTIGHELSKDLLVAFHAVDEEPLKCFLKDITEVVLGVRCSGFLERVTFNGPFS